jgi:hypothetical protein
MAIELTNELKEAIKGLPEKEKDKLLLRLLKHDLKLVERLNFELLMPYTIEEARINLKARIDRKCQKLYKVPKISDYDFHYELRDISGGITHHLNITKDKYGEVELMIYAINNLLKAFGDLIAQDKQRYYYKFPTYLLTKVMKVLLLLLKMNPDLRIDFREDLELIQELLKQNSVMKEFATENEFNFEWLDLDSLPEELPEIYKDLRTKGLY